MNLITEDNFDFSKYLEDTDPKIKVKPAAVFVQELIDSLGKQNTEPRAYLPWDKTHSLFQFRPGEVTLWAGVNGQGKSMITGLVALSLCTQGERVCIASFEMKPRKTIERMARQWSGDNPNGEWAQSAEAVAGFRDLYEQFKGWATNLWLYDQQGTVRTEKLIAVIRYCASELKLTHFFIDSLMKCVKDEDDYNGQKAFIDEVTAIARDTGMHIHVVHHIRKLSSEDQLPDKHDVKGSGSITDQVDNLLLVWRNKRKEAEVESGKMVSADTPDARLICAKQRNGEWEGRIALWFHRDSQQYLASPGGQPMELYNWPHRPTFRQAA
jgi:twinkle protein